MCAAERFGPSNKMFDRVDQGCSPKKEVGGRLKQDSDKDFLNNLSLHTRTYTHTRQKNCHSGSLVLSCDTAMPTRV